MIMMMMRRRRIMRRERRRRRKVELVVELVVVGEDEVLVEVGDEKEMTRQMMVIMMIDRTHHRAIEAVAGVKRIRRRSEVVVVKGTRIEESDRAEEEEDIASIGIGITTWIEIKFGIPGVGEMMRVPDLLRVGEEKGEGARVECITMAPTTNNNTSLPPLCHCAPWSLAWHSRISAQDNGAPTLGKSIPSIVCPMERGLSITPMAV